MSLSETYFTIRQVAKLLQRSDYSTRRLVKREIGFIRDGKRMLIPETSLKEYIDNHFINKRKGI